jgi:metal-responsive CopG/Arc/MetJ family transcriptional regulator
VKHNISITVDQKLFREIEQIREREKRSSFIEHLIILGLKDYANKNKKEVLTVKAGNTPATVFTLTPLHRNA